MMDTKDITTTTEKKVEYGWYSVKQMERMVRMDKQFRKSLHRPKYNIYLTDEGKEVPVTMGLWSNKREDVNFDDAVLQGRVVKWVRGVFQ